MKAYELLLRGKEEDKTLSIVALWEIKLCPFSLMLNIWKVQMPP